MKKDFSVIEGTKKDYTALTMEEKEIFRKLTDEEFDNLSLEEYKKYLWYARTVIHGEASEKEKELFNRLAHTDPDIYSKMVARKAEGYVPESAFEAKQIERLENDLFK